MHGREKTIEKLDKIGGFYIVFLGACFALLLFASIYDKIINKLNERKRRNQRIALAKARNPNLPYITSHKHESPNISVSKIDKLISEKNTAILSSREASNTIQKKKKQKSQLSLALNTSIKLDTQTNSDNTLSISPKKLEYDVLTAQEEFEIREIIRKTKKYIADIVKKKQFPSSSLSTDIKQTKELELAENSPQIPAYSPRLWTNVITISAAQEVAVSRFTRLWAFSFDHPLPLINIMAFIYDFHAYNLALQKINDYDYFRTALVHNVDKINITFGILQDTQTHLRYLFPIYATSLYRAYAEANIQPKTDAEINWLTNQFIPLFQFLFQQHQLGDESLKETNLSALKLALILGGDYCGAESTSKLKPDSDLMRFAMACKELRNYLAHTVNSATFIQIQELYDLSIILKAPNPHYELPEQLIALGPSTQINHPLNSFSI